MTTAMKNDYIHFHLRKADGTYFSVLDHGRIVENPQYGKVFTVLLHGLERICIFVTMINSQDNKNCKKRERMIYFHINTWFEN